MKWVFYESGKQAHRTGKWLSDNPYRDGWARSEWARGFNEEGDRVRWASHGRHGADKCFACNRPLKSSRYLVRCQDEQTVFVGPECFRKIKADGWQPPLGGPRLYRIK